MNVVTNTTMTLYFKVDVLFYFSVFGDTCHLKSIFLRVSLCRIQSVTCSFCVFQIYVVIRSTTVTRTTNAPTAIHTQGKCPVSPKKKSFRINHPANEQHSKEFVLFMISLLRCFYRVFFFFLLQYYKFIRPSSLLYSYVSVFAL